MVLLAALPSRPDALFPPPLLSPLQVLPFVLLALAASAPVFLHAPKLGGAGGEGGATGSAARRRRRLAPWQGLLHVVCVLVALALARFAVFDIVQVRGG